MRFLSSHLVNRIIPSFWVTISIKWSNSQVQAGILDLVATPDNDHLGFETSLGERPRWVWTWRPKQTIVWNTTIGILWYIMMVIILHCFFWEDFKATVRVATSHNFTILNCGRAKVWGESFNNSFWAGQKCVWKQYFFLGNTCFLGWLFEKFTLSRLDEVNTCLNGTSSH